MPRKMQVRGDQQISQPDVGYVLSARGDKSVQGLATAATFNAPSFAGTSGEFKAPTDWDGRARLAWDYYLTEPIVKNCINSWRTFAIGNDVKITCDDTDIQKESRSFSDALEIVTFVKDMILQLLVKGDCVGNKVKEGEVIKELQCVNPVSVDIKYEDGQISEIKQTGNAERDKDSSSRTPIALSPENIIHLKWDAPKFSVRGNSMVLPAFESIELLKQYRRTERAIASRWATPFRLIKVGGSFGQKIIMPDQAMLQRVSNAINSMDMRSGLVVPFYTSVETHGTDSQVLNIEEKVRETKEDIMVSLGLSRALVTGDGPNFATAAVSMQKMIVMVNEIKHFALKILTWIFDDWRKASGHDQATLQFNLGDIDFMEGVDLKKVLIELYDRKLISKQSLQAKMDLDPTIESANNEANKTPMDTFDPKEVKMAVDMVMGGVISPEAAQKLLNIPGDMLPAKPTVESYNGTGEALASMLARGAVTVTCDSCAHFDLDKNFCSIHAAERRFDAKACRFIEAR